MREVYAEIGETTCIYYMYALAHMYNSASSRARLLGVSRVPFGGSTRKLCYSQAGGPASALRLGEGYAQVPQGLVREARS